MKSAIQFFILSFVLLTFISCKPEKNPAKLLVGEWKADGVPVSLSIKEDKTYQWTFPLGFTHSGEYHLTPGKNELLLVRRDGGELYFHFDTDGRNLILWNYKMGKEIKNLLDEVLLLHKEGADDKIPELTRKERYQLAADFIGKVLVGFEGKEEENDPEMLIEIPSSGCIQVDQAASIPTLAFDQYTFYRGDQEISFIQWMKAKYRKNTFSQEELNSIYVMVDGFNQWARDDLNDECQMYFDKNVLNFRVDTLKDLLKAW